MFCFGPDEFLSHSSVARQVVDKLGEVAVGCVGGRGDSRGGGRCLVYPWHCAKTGAS